MERWIHTDDTYLRVREISLFEQRFHVILSHSETFWVGTLLAQHTMHTHVDSW